MLPINNNSPSFKAIPVSKVFLRSEKASSPVIVYELSKKDYPFLKKMVNKIRLDKLVENNPKRADLKTWKKLILTAYEDLKYDKVLLAVKDKTPCGILSYIKLPGEGMYLSSIASIPIKKDKYAKVAGKSLIRELFERAYKTNATHIRGYVDSSEPKILKFYEDVGFHITDFNLFYHKSDFFQKATARMDNYLEYVPIKNAKEVNLSKKCKLDFCPTMFERIKSIFKTN